VKTGCWRGEWSTPRDTIFLLWSGDLFCISISLIFYNLLESWVWDSLRICKSDQSLAQHDKELVIIYVIQFTVLHEKVDSHRPHDLKTHAMCHVTLKISQILGFLFALSPPAHCGNEHFWGWKFYNTIGTLYCLFHCFWGDIELCPHSIEFQTYLLTELGGKK
jgi:hypothetical protein